MLLINCKRYYASTSRQLNRLMTVSRSPLYSHLGETLGGNGTASISAFRVKERFLKGFGRKLDSCMGCLFALQMTKRFLIQSEQTRIIYG